MPDAGVVRVRLVVAAPREVADVLQATGTLMPDQQSALTPLVAGRVVAVLVERGQRVNEGDPILRLRDVDYRSQAASAQAAVNQARARLGITDGAGAFDPERASEVRAAAAQRDMAEDSLRRAEGLHTSGAMSDADYNRVSSQASAAREQYRSALNMTRAGWFAYQQSREVVSAAQRAVADSVVRAPFAGEIAERTIAAGEYVTPQRAVVTLVRTDPLRMELQIPQERIARVRRGQTVDIRVDAYPERVFRATVQYISAAVRAETRSLVAEAVLPNADHLLRPGLFATARVDLGTRRAVLAIPSRALVNEAGVQRVYVVANGRATERVVTVAERDGDTALIERGLNPNERVVVEGVADVRDGSAVVER